MLNNFIYAKQKSLFEEALNNGEVLDEAIVFIEDTKEIWNHGTYFDGSKVDLSNIEDSILNILDNYATKSELPTKISLLENDVPYALKSDVEVEVEAENGVYIVDLNGTLHDPNAFTGTADDVTGIGLVTDNGSWIVALDEWYSTSESTAWNGNIRSAWGGDGTKVTGCWSGNQTKALLDFDGEANTDAIIAQLKGTTDNYSQYYTGAPAAEYCRAYSKGYKDVGSWYLPAAGELNEISLNKDAINAILTKLGKNSLLRYTCSSSQSGSSFAWSYYWSTSSWATGLKNDSYGVRPICKLELKKLVKERIKDLESGLKDIENNYVTTNTELVINGKKIIQDTSFRVQSTSQNACIVTAHGGDYSAVLLLNISKTNGNTPSTYQLSNTTGGAIVMMTARPDSSKSSGNINLITKDYETLISPKLGLFNREDYPYKCAIIGVLLGLTVRTPLTHLANGVDLLGGHVLITPIYEDLMDSSSAHFEWDKDTHILKINEYYPDDVTIRDIADVQINGYSIMTTKWSKLTLPSFTIEGVSYDFEEGMTWEEWVNSEYNDGSFTISDGITLKYGGFTIMIEGGYITHPKDVIIANGIYYQRLDTGGSN